MCVCVGGRGRGGVYVVCMCMCVSACIFLHDTVQMFVGCQQPRTWFSNAVCAGHGSSLNFAGLSGV